MERKVLVAYATKAGSTRELALAVAEELRRRGLMADAEPVGAARALDEYGAVIVCAALYVGRLHKDARRFLADRRETLAKLPVALFVPGPVHTVEKEFVDARRQLDKELSNFPWFKPIAIHVVGGLFDPAKLGFPFRYIPAMKKMPASDARNWEAVRAQAGELAGQFGPSLRV